MTLISLEEFYKGCDAFQRRERRDAMYKTATFLVDHFWGKPSEVADSLGVLLLTWNSAFYRYGTFDFEELERCIAQNQTVLDAYRHRDILSYQSTDERQIVDLFEQFIDALKICEGKEGVRGRRSPVSVAKALHVLAPAFFPLWDQKIAQAYSCKYDYNPSGKYVTFFKSMKEIVHEIQPYLAAKSNGKRY